MPETFACARASGSIPNPRMEEGAGGRGPRHLPLVQHAVPQTPTPRWERPELLLPGSLSPPGTRTASNRSGKSSISLADRTSDSQSWRLISELSKPFSQHSVASSSFFQLTNLCLVHVAHQRRAVPPTAWPSHPALISTPALTSRLFSCLLGSQRLFLTSAFSCYLEKAPI